MIKLGGGSIGGGTRMFDALDHPTELTHLHCAAGRGATHLRFRVVQSAAQQHSSWLGSINSPEETAGRQGRTLLSLHKA